MYIPKFFLEENEERILAFMQRFNFATLVTSENDFPTATHLPFIIEKRDGKIILSAHMAKANAHWKQLDRETLTIFHEPHAYISPLLYGEMPNVPTWNYVAVHAYGRAKIVDGTKTLTLIEKQLVGFDPDYFETEWQKISDEYKTNLLKGVVAFEIEVSDLQAKKKLNQNKTGKTAENVIEAFEKSDDENQKLIAEYMKEVHRPKEI